MRKSYFKRKKNFKTKLIKKGPAPEHWVELKNSKKNNVIFYKSGKLKLKAIINSQNIDPTKKNPVIVYLHGGFALSMGDIKDCQPFIDKGYIVFAPSYRGENGNPGNFELFMGELDDVAASIKWISKQPYVDTSKIFVFGHSIGGGLSSLLSLLKNLPVKLTASCGGIYSSDFYRWDELLPFDSKNKEEKKMRVLIDCKQIKSKHIAYIGKEDEGFSYYLKNLKKKTKGTKLKIKVIKGNHFSSLNFAMKDFLKRIKRMMKVEG